MFKSWPGKGWALSGCRGQWLYQPNAANEFELRVKEWKRDGKPAQTARDALPGATIDRFHEP
jgi:hypothetical protein